MSDSTRYLKGLKAYASTMLRCQQATECFQISLRRPYPDRKLFEREEFQAPVELNDPDLDAELRDFLNCTLKRCVDELYNSYGFYLQAAERTDRGLDQHAEERMAGHCVCLAAACWSLAQEIGAIGFDRLLRR